MMASRRTLHSSMARLVMPAPIFGLFEGKVSPPAMGKAAGAQSDEGECKEAVFAGQYYLAKCAMRSRPCPKCRRRRS